MTTNQNHPLIGMVPACLGIAGASECRVGGVCAGGQRVGLLGFGLGADRSLVATDATGEPERPQKCRPPPNTLYAFQSPGSTSAKRIRLPQLSQSISRDLAILLPKMKELNTRSYQYFEQAATSIPRPADQTCPRRMRR